MRMVIEKNCFPENENKFISILGKENVALIKYRPFDKTKWFDVDEKSGFDPHSMDEELNIFFYGSLNLGRRLRKYYNWNIWLPKNEFDCTYWISRLNEMGKEKDFCLNNFFNSIIIPYGSIRDALNTSNPLVYDNIFIRPNSGYKTFTGHVINDKYSNEIEQLGEQYNIQPEELILISSTKKIDAEYRFVIYHDLDKGHEIVTGSPYKRNNEYNEEGGIPIKIMDQVHQLINMINNEENYYPAPLWTLDIAEVNNMCYILETGSFTSAGLYQCEIIDIVNVMKKYLGTK